MRSSTEIDAELVAARAELTMRQNRIVKDTARVAALSNQYFPDRGIIGQLERDLIKAKRVEGDDGKPTALGLARRYRPLPQAEILEEIATQSYRVGWDCNTVDSYTTVDATSPKAAAEAWISDYGNERRDLIGKVDLREFMDEQGQVVVIAPDGAVHMFDVTARFVWAVKEVPDAT